MPGERVTAGGDHLQKQLPSTEPTNPLPYGEMPFVLLVASSGPLTSNTLSLPLTPLNSPDRSRCSRVIVIETLCSETPSNIIFLSPARTVLGVQGFGRFEGNLANMQQIASWGVSFPWERPKPS